MGKSKASGKEKRPNRETNQSVLRQAMIRRLPRRLGASGQMLLPAAPSLLEHYVQNLHQLFAQLGRIFSREETERLREIMKAKLEEAFTASPYTRVVVNYETDAPPKTSLTYRVNLAPSSIADEYEGWVKTRTPPFFGAHPDAKVMAAAHALGEPKDVPVLDIGAGTGRNTLPLARAGFPADAIELTPALAAILRAEVEKEGLKVKVFEGDATGEGIEIPDHHYRLVFLAEVIASHIRDNAQVRSLFEGAADALMTGGQLLFNAFLPVDGYRPDALARELSQIFWCNLFTRNDLTAAMQGLPFELVSDESTHDFELEFQPKEGWPPTGWFVDWARGHDLFDLPAGRSPMELRWLTYRRT